MKEQSHKSEMRAALRGDFERLHARRQETVEAIPPMVEPNEPPTQPVVAEAEAPRPSWRDRFRDLR